MRTGKETAGPSTALRSGRDDNPFVGNGLKTGEHQTPKGRKVRISLNLRRCLGEEHTLGPEGQ